MFDTVCNLKSCIYLKHLFTHRAHVWVTFSNLTVFDTPTHHAYTILIFMPTNYPPMRAQIFMPTNYPPMRAQIQYDVIMTTEKRNISSRNIIMHHIQYRNVVTTCRNIIIFIHVVL